MIDLKEYTKENNGKNVLISTLSGKVEGVLYSTKTDPQGNVDTLVIKQYLHRTEVPAREILNIRIL
ncbi:MAG TPA: hypothetical protein VNB90_11195 [Cytophagaceae bacterium]|jgi:hypothetical protein|nr:hypothetical protein [Cytophagaceae bacterium]